MNNAPSTKSYARRFWPVRIVVVALLCIVLASMFVAEKNAQDSTRKDLAEKFASRSDTASTFLKAYITQVLGHERELASLRLDTPTVSHEQFLSYVESLDFGPAMLLDETGHVIEVAPRDDSLIGKDMSNEFEHLSKGVAGHQNVSNMVPSTVQNIPIVAFVTPYDSAAGRRIVSGAFDLSMTPIGEYLDHISTYKGSHVYLLDAQNNIVASSSRSVGTFSKVDRSLAKAASKTRSSGQYEDSHGVDTHYVSDPIDGTPWRLVVTSPSSQIFAPLHGSNGTLPWIFLSVFALAAIFIVIKGLQSREQRIRLQDNATVDLLTGIANKRGASASLLQLVSAARRRQTDLTLLVLDVDDFKTFNENHGHGVGDEALKSVAQHVQSCLRAEDFFARWEGAEFLIMLPETNVTGSQVVAERIRERIARSVNADINAETQVTVSVGIASHVQEDDVESLIARAQEAVREAKETGRNKVIVAKDPVPAPAK